ncbi:hypothetical protein ACJX0J_015321 [Zea mays]
MQQYIEKHVNSDNVVFSEKVIHYLIKDIYFDMHSTCFVAYDRSIVRLASPLVASAQDKQTIFLVMQEDNFFYQSQKDIKEVYGLLTLATHSSDRNMTGDINCLDGGAAGGEKERFNQIYIINKKCCALYYITNITIKRVFQAFIVLASLRHKGHYKFSAQYDSQSSSLV